MDGSEFESSYFYEYSRGWARERCCILAVESQVLSGRKHCWSNDREREGEGDMEDRGRYACVWDLKGTAPGCLGYLFLSKAMWCLEKEASCVLNATVRTRSILLHLP